MKKLALILAVIVAVALTNSAPGQLNLITNGGFEAPTFSFGGSRLSAVEPPTGWTVTLGQGVHMNNPGTATVSGLPPALEGSQFYYIGDGGAHSNILQSVSLFAGQPYQLSFSLSPLIGASWGAANYDAKVDLTISSPSETFLPGLTYDFVVPAAVQNWEPKTYSFTPNYTANYTITFTTLGGGTDAASIDNVVLAAAPVVPEITVVPSPRQVVNLGQNLTLSVTATGTPAPTYQWKRNGLPIPGATLASYTITGASPVRDTGWYQVVLANSVGSMTSPVMFVNVLVSSAQLVAWGRNRNGESAVPAGLTSIAGIAAGLIHNVVLKSDGTVLAWGSVGNSVPTNLREVVGIAAGNSHSLALKSDGAVASWGDNSYGQNELPVGLANVVAVAEGAYCSLALRSDGTVVSWGRGPGADYGQNNIPPGLNGVVAISAGGNHHMALKNDGTVSVWGSNDQGQCNVPAGLDSVVRISAGSYYCMALRNNGTVVAWGNQTSVPSGLNDVVAIAAGGLHRLAQRSDGTVIAWAPGENVITSVPAGMTGVTNMAAGWENSLVVRDANIPFAPVVISQPLPPSVGLGESASFSVIATGTAPLTYQWRKGGVNLPGATSTNHFIPSVQPADGGNYDVVVSNSLGSFTSNAAVLAVMPAGGVPTYTVSTLVGSAGSSGSTDGTGSAARFNRPSSLAVDGNGNVFVADTANHTIRRISVGRVVTTLAGAAGTPGSADGTGSSARFNNPSGVAVDGSGNVFVADSSNHTIRKVTSGGVVTTLAGLPGTSGSVDGIGSTARFDGPSGVAVDGSGNVFVTDFNSFIIRKVGTAGLVTTLAGTVRVSGSANGSGGDAKFNRPLGLAVDGSDNLYVADRNNHTIRKAGGESWVTTLAGTAGSIGSADGTGALAQFNYPDDLTVDSLGNVFVADSDNHTIRMITPAGVVTTLAGLEGSSGNVDGVGSAARFSAPSGVSIDRSGNLYIADDPNHTIRKLTVSYASLVAPVITTSPASQTIATGGSVNFTVVATGTAPIYYQWRKGGTAISGATSATFIIASCQAGDTGSYDVILTNAVGNATSNSALLTVSGTVPQDFTYTVGANAVTITGYTGPGGVVAIPNSIGGLPVTAIAGDAFRDKTTLASITIPASVLTIAPDAFANSGSGVLVDPANPNFSSLDHVLFNKDRTLLIQCSSTKTGIYVIPAGVTQIRGNAFYNCRGLTSITIPAGITAIAAYTFTNCSLLSSLVLPSTVTDIDFNFLGCNSLATLSIPASVTRIASGALAGGEGITRVNVDAGNPSYSSIDGVLYNKNQTVLVMWPRGRTDNCVVPAGVVEIAEGGFFASSSQTRVTIPASVATIGFHAFIDSLANITVDDGNPNYSSLDDVLFDKNRTRLIAVSARKKGRYVMPASVTTIETDAFYHTPELTSLTVSAGMTSLGQHVFFGCSGLTTVVIPASVTSIHQAAFSNSGGLTAVYFQGNAPPAQGQFDGALNSTVYYIAGTAGWGPTFGTRPTATYLALAISTQPVSRSVAVGAPATFTVVAIGNPTPTFQWRKNGTDINGATNATYTIANAQPADAGSYDVVATDAITSGTSSAATLTVNPAVPTLANVSVQRRTGAKLVDITFDLSHPQSLASTITVEVSKDGGTTWTGSPLTFTGAIGAGITAGSGKVVMWNAGADWPSQSFSNVRVRVMANDGQSGMMRIPGGTFTMGSVVTSNTTDTSDGTTDATPHAVTLSTFYLAKTETTWAEWVAVRDWAVASGYTDLASVGAGKGDNYPVQGVSWYDVVQWLNAKSEKDGLVPVYYTNDVQTSVYRTGRVDMTNAQVKWAASGYRLPTEAEWEYAARGGLVGRRFPWGDTISHQQANYTSDASYAYDLSATRGSHPTYATGSPPYTSPVGSFAANGYGLVDIAGNVWEWCWDWAGSYGNVAVTDPRGPGSSGTFRMSRGGGWSNPAYGARSANRNVNFPDGGTSTSQLGLRQARNVATDGNIVSASSAIFALDLSDVSVAPLIVTQPQSLTVNPGGTATFTVVATGTPAPAYQWRKGGTNISGATNAAYSIASAQSGDVGSYDVVATNVAGAVTSTAATLAVKMLPSISWVVPAQVAFGQAMGASLKTASAAIAGTLSYTPADGTVLGVGRHQLSATFTPTDAANYTATTFRVNVTVLSSGISPDGRYAAAVPSGKEVLLVAARTTGAVSAYDASTGILLIENLLTNVGDPQGLAVDTQNRRIYIADYSGSGAIACYNTALRAPLQKPLVAFSSPGFPQRLALSQDARYLYIPFHGSVVGRYDLSTGLLEPTFITGLWSANTVVVGREGRLYVSTDNLNTDGVWSIPSSGGSAGNALVAGLWFTSGMALDGEGALYVQTDRYGIGTSYIRKYNATTGAAINAALVADTSANFTALTNAGNYLYVAVDRGGSTIDLYRADTGERLVQGFVSSAGGPTAIALAPAEIINAIDFPPIPTLLLSASPVAMVATSTAGLPVTYSVVSGPATVLGNLLSLTGTGIVTVRASQVGNTAYAAAPDVTQSFVVNSPLAITTQPQSLTVNPGGTATFTVVATGTPTPTYQWRKDGVNLTGSTNATLSIANVQPVNIGDYSVIVSNSAGSVTSSSASLSVAGVNSGIWRGLVAQYLFSGNAMDSTSTHLDFQSAPAFTTDRYGTNLSAAQFGGGPPLATASIPLGQNGFSVSFWLRLTKTPSIGGERMVMHGSWNVGSGLFSVAVWGDGRIAMSVSDAAGSPANSVDSQAGAISTNVWYQIIAYADGSTTNLAVNGGKIASSPVTLGTRNAPFLVGGDTPDYRFVSGVIDDVRLYNRALSTIEIADLFTSEVPPSLQVVPTIVTHPISSTISTGAVSFSVVAMGNPAPTFQWRKGGTNISGATNSSYTIAAVQLADAGSYDVVVTNAVGSVTSNAAALTVIPSGSVATYTVSTVVGLAGSSGSADGTGSAAGFSHPLGVAVDSGGNVFVADSANHTIRKISPAGVVTALAGLPGSPGSADGTGSGARLRNPLGVTVDSAGNVFVADNGNHTIRKITSVGAVTTLAGLAGSFGSADGTGNTARFNFPGGVVVDSAGNVFVADCSNDTIRKVTPGGAVTTLAGLAGSPGGADGTGGAARFNVPHGLALDNGGNVFVADYSNHTIRKVTSAGVVTTLAGLGGSSGSADGTGSAARFNLPQGVAMDSAGNLFVADAVNHTIRRVTPEGVVTTIAGLAGSSGSTDGLGSVSRLNFPGGIAVDSSGSFFVGDWGNHTIRKLTVSYNGSAVAPAITTQPASQSVAVGATATFSVVATGSPAPSYQWRKGNANISGATSAAYSIATCQTSDAGSYDVVVSNGVLPNATSALAILTVNVQPSIISQPVGTTIVSGASATLTVAATGSGPFTYQWYQGNTGATAQLINGAVTANYTTPVLTATTSYWVRVSGPGGTVDSATGTVVVATYAPTVAFSVEGPGQYMTSGGTVTLRVRVTYTGQTPSAIGATVNLPAGWSLVSTGGPNVPQVAPAGGTTNVLEWGYTGFPTNQAEFTFLLNTPAGQSGAKVLGGFVNYRPENVNVTLPSVTLVGVTPLVITTQPHTLQVEFGQPATLSVVATGDPAPNFQWRKDGVAVAGATSASLYITAVTMSHGGYYDVVVSNGVATPVTSNQVLLGVIPTGTLATHLTVGGGHTQLSKVTISNTITYPGTATALGWSVLLPAGWSYDSDGGTAGENKPPANATGLIEWAWTTIPISPVTFTYTLNKPVGAAGDVNLIGLAVVRLQDLGWRLELLARPDPLVIKPVAHHSADTDRNFKINLTELTRVIELYNTRLSTNRTGRYRVEGGTEDGFAPDPQATSNQVLSIYHAADSNRSGHLDLIELTRVIELYNTRAGTVRTGQYRAVPPPAVTEDGFAPGL